MPENMWLRRDEVTKRLTETYKKNQRTHNTRSKKVQFKEEQTVYRKNFRLSIMAGIYNVKLVPFNVKFLIT